MPSPTEIVKHALDLIDSSPISDLDAPDGKSQRCKRMYEMTLGILLEKDDWRFAKGRVSIGTTEATPVNGWAYAYALPADCRKPIRINDDDLTAWAQEQRTIVTDQVAPIILEYIKDVSDPNIWDATFREAFTAYLASEYARAFKSDPDKAAQLFQLYKDHLGEAIAKNGQTGTPLRPLIGTLTDIRRY